MKKRFGFSLMEMMVVMLIISIIAAASAPMVNKRMLQSVADKSPWIWTSGQNIAYNLSGNNTLVASVGSSVVPEGASARLYLNTAKNNPHLSFGENGANNIKLFASANRIALSSEDHSSNTNVLVFGPGTKAVNNSVSVGVDTEAKADNSIAFGYGSIAGAANALAMGRSANASGLRSIALGYSANTGSYNNTVAIGYNSTTDANAAIAIGSDSYSKSIAIGANARADSSSDVAIGDNAKALKTQAVSIGANSAASSYSIALGDNAGAGVTADKTQGTGTSAIAIGVNADSDSNGIAIGNSSNTNNGAIAIGVGGTEKDENNKDVTYKTSAAGINSIAIGVKAYAQYENNIAIGYNARATNTNAVAIGANAEANQANQIVLGTAGSTVYIPGKLVVRGDTYLAYGNEEQTDTPYVFIGVAQKNKTNWTHRRVIKEDTGTEAYRTLRVHKDTGREFDVGSDPLSDRRLKNVGEAFKAGLDEIKKLEVFHYTFKKDPNQTPRVGVMAQDLQKIFPEAVFKGEDGFLRIRMEDMFYAAINAIKEIADKIIAHDKRIDELTKQNEELISIIDQLEARLEELEK